MSEIVKYTILRNQPEIELWVSTSDNGVCLMGRDSKGTVKRLISFKSDGSVQLQRDAQLAGLSFSVEGHMLVECEEKWEEKS